MPKKYGIVQRFRVWILGSYRDSIQNEEQFPETAKGCSNCEIRSLFLSELKKFYKSTSKEHKETVSASLDPTELYYEMLKGKV